MDHLGYVEVQVRGSVASAGAPTTTALAERNERRMQ